jgi:hypothetical protein
MSDINRILTLAGLRLDEAYGSTSDADYMDRKSMNLPDGYVKMAAGNPQTRKKMPGSIGGNRHNTQSNWMSPEEQDEDKRMFGETEEMEDECDEEPISEECEDAEEGEEEPVTEADDWSAFEPNVNNPPQPANPNAKPAAPQQPRRQGDSDAMWAEIDSGKITAATNKSVFGEVANFLKSKAKNVGISAGATHFTYGGYNFELSNGRIDCEPADGIRRLVISLSKGGPITGMSESATKKKTEKTNETKAFHKRMYERHAKLANKNKKIAESYQSRCRQAKLNENRKNVAYNENWQNHHIAECQHHINRMKYHATKMK